MTILLTRLANKIRQIFEWLEQKEMESIERHMLKHNPWYRMQNESYRKEASKKETHEDRK